MDGSNPVTAERVNVTHAAPGRVRGAAAAASLGQARPVRRGRAGGGSRGPAAMASSGGRMAASPSPPTTRTCRPTWSPCPPAWPGRWRRCWSATTSSSAGVTSCCGWTTGICGPPRRARWRMSRPRRADIAALGAQLRLQGSTVTASDADVASAGRLGHLRQGGVVPLRRPGADGQRLGAARPAGGGGYPRPRCRGVAGPRRRRRVAQADRRVAGAAGPGAGGLAAGPGCGGPGRAEPVLWHRHRAGGRGGGRPVRPGGPIRPARQRGC